MRPGEKLEVSLTLYSAILEITGRGGSIFHQIQITLHIKLASRRWYDKHNLLSGGVREAPNQAMLKLRDSRA